MTLHRNRVRTNVIITIVLIAMGASAVIAEDIPAGAWEGNWIANTAKSKFPGTPPKVDQVKIQADGSIAVHVVSADGKVADWSYKPQKGQFVPIQGRDKLTVQIVKVNDHQLNQIWNANGKITRSHATLSQDGKTQTFYGAPGTDSAGKPFQEVVVYERQ
jgi:hypothetical protein